MLHTHSTTSSRSLFIFFPVLIPPKYEVITKTRRCPSTRHLASWLWHIRMHIQPDKTCSPSAPSWVTRTLWRYATRDTAALLWYVIYGGPNERRHLFVIFYGAWILKQKARYVDECRDRRECLEFDARLVGWNRVGTDDVMAEEMQNGDLIE